MNCIAFACKALCTMQNSSVKIKWSEVSVLQMLSRRLGYEKMLASLGALLHTFIYHCIGMRFVRYSNPMRRLHQILWHTLKDIAAVEFFKTHCEGKEIALEKTKEAHFSAMKNRKVKQRTWGCRRNAEIQSVAAWHSASEFRMLIVAFVYLQTAAYSCKTLSKMEKIQPMG